MNDFTKEELFIISNIVLSHFCDPTLGQVNEKLITKIQSMIDNYDYDAKTIEVWHCEKCGHVQ